MTGLKQLLVDYVETGSTDGFESVCQANGWRYERRNGVHLAYNADGRLVMAALVDVRDGRREPLSTKSCATCGSAPVGSSEAGLTIDDRRRYACGPHEPIWALGGRRRHEADHPPRGAGGGHDRG